MKDGAMGFEEVALTTVAIQLPPRAPAGMTIGRESAQPAPAAIAPVGIGTALLGGVDVAPAATCRDNTRRGARRLTVSCDGLLTGVAVGFTSETRKGLGRFGAFSGRRQRL